MSELSAENDAAKMRVEWTVKHSQGIHPGPFTEKSAREWIANDIKADERRKSAYRGRQQLLRRYVTEWEEVPLDAPIPPAVTDAPLPTDTDSMTRALAPRGEA